MLCFCLFVFKAKNLNILKFTGDGQLASFIQSPTSIMRAMLSAGLEGYGFWSQECKAVIYSVFTPFCPGV